MTGTLTNLLGVGEESVDNVTMNQTMPDVYRLGVRYRPIERLELRLFGELIRWSAFEQQCITNNEIEGDAASVCEVGLNGAQLSDENAAKVVQNLIRRWNDAFGVRLGGSYWFSDEFELFVGGGYDSNAVPDESLEPALPDWDKLNASLGARLELGGFMAIMLTVTNLFYLERDTSDVQTAERFRSVSRQPSSAGIYSQNIFLFNTNLEFFFGGGE
jgi:long-chain fatty acid transport protein